MPSLEVVAPPQQQPHSPGTSPSSTHPPRKTSIIINGTLSTSPQPLTNGVPPPFTQSTTNVAQPPTSFPPPSQPTQHPPNGSLERSPTQPAPSLTRSETDGGLMVLKRRSNTTSALGPDEDAARWTERIKERRIISSKRKLDETADEEDRVIIGTKVAEGHGNFETAYNMLTGIRFCVSRCNAKIDRDLTSADFRECKKTSFDVLGTELTPATKYDFKFKDYAPWVFRHLRQLFNIDPANYLMSLTEKYILSELGSPGKSGSFFYFSRDYRYIIKTVHHYEAKFLRKILPQYYEHVRENPDTLISQFYGLHRVKTSKGTVFWCVVMNNLFPPHKDIHRTYDLKGSLEGREYDEALLKDNPQATLKDLNWLNRNMHLEFGPTKGEKLKAQMERDVRFLQQNAIMDYSLLVGIHDLKRGNRENLRNKTLKVFQPGGERILSSNNHTSGPGSAGPNANAQSSTAGGAGNLPPLSEGATTTSFEPPNSGAAGPPPALLTRTPSKIENARKASQLRQLVKAERPVPMDQTLSKMPERQIPDESKAKTFFYGEEGGFRATHESDRPGEEIYYLGIIDLLTRYSLIKRMEHLYKSFSQPDKEISAVPPERYGDRFLAFMTKAVAPREQAGDFVL